MFGKPGKEPNPPEVKDLQEVMFSIKQNLEPDQDKADINLVDPPTPEVVTVVENISKILSRYLSFWWVYSSMIGIVLSVSC